MEGTSTQPHRTEATYLRQMERERQELDKKNPQPNKENLKNQPSRENQDNES